AGEQQRSREARKRTHILRRHRSAADARPWLRFLRSPGRHYRAGLALLRHDARKGKQARTGVGETENDLGVPSDHEHQAAVKKRTTRRTGGGKSGNPKPWLPDPQSIREVKEIRAPAGPVSIIRTDIVDPYEPPITPKKRRKQKGPR